MCSLSRLLVFALNLIAFPICVPMRVARMISSARLVKRLPTPLPSRFSLLDSLSLRITECDQVLPARPTKTPIRLKSSMVPATLFHTGSSEPTLSTRGKIWSSDRAILTADPGGIGITLTSRSVKAKSPRRKTGSLLERDIVSVFAPRWPRYFLGSGSEVWRGGGSGKRGR